MLGPNRGGSEVVRSWLFFKRQGVCGRTGGVISALNRGGGKVIGPGYSSRGNESAGG